MTNHAVVQNHSIGARRLSVLFALSLVAIVGAADVVWIWLLDIPFLSDKNLSFLYIFSGFLVSLALFQLLVMSRDGPAIAKLLGGTPVPDQPADLMTKTYCQVASEVLLAAAVPAPQLFVMKRERRINAFAAGQLGSKTAICVSAGALENLTREELQGVVAHEMAHLKFDDVRLSKWLSSGLFALLGLTGLGMFLMAALGAVGQGNGKGEGAAAALLLGLSGLVLVLIGGVGYCCAGMISAGVSRKMEFRADAEAVRMLSSSAGLVGALVKLTHEARRIDDDSDGMNADNPLCLREASRKFWFDTHPPLLARIRALDPQRAIELESTL